MILFSEIYDKAINLFDDPRIRRSYVYNKIEFQRTMYSHFQNGISLFVNPLAISMALSDQQLPEGELEIIDGNGERTYQLSTVPLKNSIMIFKIANRVDNEATFDFDKNEVTFSQNVMEGTQCSVEWNFCGCFNTDFKNIATPRMSAATMTGYVKDILARALVLAWAENEENFLLDIRNLLNDTDFKLYSPANSVKAKGEWVSRLRAQFDSLQNKLSWMMFAQFRGGGQIYGP